MKQSLLKNKRAVSGIVAYALLIIIVVTLASVAFAFLRAFIPQETPTCDKEVSLILEDYDCNMVSATINITLSNRGLFTADAVYLGMGPESQRIKERINPEDFVLEDPEQGGVGLKPGQKYNIYLNNLAIDLGIDEQYELEIQPAIIENKDILVCTNSIVTYPVDCN